MKHTEQKNSYDCGTFVCKFYEDLLTGKSTSEFDNPEKDLVEYRAKIERRIRFKRKFLWINFKKRILIVFIFKAQFAEFCCVCGNFKHENHPRMKLEKCCFCYRNYHKACFKLSKKQSCIGCNF